MIPVTFEFIQTNDGSSSLVLEENGVKEAMHHLDGASEETFYINSQIIQDAFNHFEEPRFLIVGLGLAYIEILIAAFGVKYKKPCYIESCETVEDLKGNFSAWLKGRTEPNAFDQVYQLAAERAGARLEVDSNEIRGYLAHLNASGKLQFRDSVLDLQALSSGFHCICFDPFSRKASPEVWDETFLTKFLSHAASEKCGFATYSSRGTLKRALLASQFKVLKRPGYSGKRDCISATRG